MDSPTRLVIIDDHEIVRRGVVDLLATEADLEVVADGGTSESAIALVEAHRPDVVVLDVRLGDSSGVQACQAIKADHPKTHVLMFTSYADPDALEASLGAGAAGFVLKRIDLGELIDAIRRVVGGETVLDPEAVQLLEARAAGEGVRDARLRKLSSQERKVLSLIALGRTNRQIAAEMELAEKTVKNYVSNLLRKLGLTRRAEAAVFRAGLGD
ncbi:MAG TPA: response regulator transcription factor [Actinobacteria bacterium]|nr:response regulator transcription factor [Actinomycetota bacterium]